MADNWTDLTEGGWELQGFEEGIPDIETRHKLDLKFTRRDPITDILQTKSVEMKNWSDARSISGKMYSQFKAYVSSGHYFDYYFSDEVKDQMKKNFQNMFLDEGKAKELWESNENFFTNLNPEITSWEELVKLAKDDKLVDFINWVK